MKYFLRANIYETQAILYWILGVLILHLGKWHWLGWLAIAWGWFTTVVVIFSCAKHSEEIKDWLRN